MFDYKISKHPHFDEACRAFALRHNMAKLAECAGMNVQTLRNKLNPEQPHQLTPPEIWLLTDITEDSTLVDGFLAQIHCLPCVPLNEVAKENLPHYVMSATAEIGRVKKSAKKPADHCVTAPSMSAPGRHCTVSSNSVSLVFRGVRHTVSCACWLVRRRECRANAKRVRRYWIIRVWMRYWQLQMRVALPPTS